jgi:hypothetical protein
MVQRACPFCGSSKTSEHNVVFLEGVKAALTADDAFKGGWYDDMSEVQKGIRAAVRAYAGWGFSQAFYWDEVYKELGFSSLEDFLVGFWEGFFLSNRDPNKVAAGGKGAVFPARGRGVRERVHTERGVQRHPRRVGSLRRRWSKSGRHEVHRRRAQGPPRR